MATKIINILNANYHRTLNFTFTISLALICALFLLCILLIFLKNDYVLRKRIWFFTISIGIISMETAVLDVIYAKKSFSLISLGLALIFSGIILSLKTKKESENLNEIIDKHIDVPIRIDKLEKAPRKVEEKISLCKEVEKPKQTGIDYSHVKSVIERISLLSLTQTDRKTIRDLEFNVLSAEKGDDRLETKQKINDGLGALLKIMSKYGV